MKKILFLALALIPCLLMGQVVKVIDRKDSKPVSDVLLISSDQTKTSITDGLGRADISMFGEGDIILFQHPSYLSIETDLPGIKKNVYRIYLEQKVIDLEQLVVSASRFEQKRTEIPNRIILIKPGEILLENPQTAADMLEKTGQVFVQKSQLGGGSPMIRGFAANAVLISVDGVRMNNAIFRSGNLQNVINIDPNILERSEVIFGPGTVIYGSDAMGGVMDFHTIRPPLSFDQKTNFGANAMLRYSTANNEKSGHVDFSIGGAKFSSFTSFSYSDFGDLRMGSNGNDELKRLHYMDYTDGKDSMYINDDPDIQKYTAYSLYNLSQKFRYRPGDQLDIIYGFHYSNTTDIPRYDKLQEYSDGVLKYAEWYYGPQLWMMNNLEVNYNQANKIFDNLKSSFAWQVFEESRHNRKSGDTEIDEQIEKVNVFSLNINMDKELAKSVLLFYGLESSLNTVKSKAHTRDIITGMEGKLNTRYPDGDNYLKNAAIYAGIRKDLSEKYILNAGIRFNYISLHSSFIDTSFYQFSNEDIENQNAAINGSLGLAWHPGANTRLNINFSSGFRAPNLDGLAKVFQPSKANVLVPNDDLKPEYSYNAEAGLLQTFGSFVQLEASIYYSYLKDAIVEDYFTYKGSNQIIYDGDTNNVIALVNSGHAHIYGASILFKVRFSEHWNASTRMSWSDGEDSDNMPLRHIAPVFGSTDLSFTQGRFNADLIVRYNGEKPYEELSLSERDKTYMYAIDGDGNPYSPAWWTLNFKASLDILKNTKLSIGLENILDKRYRTYSSGVSAPGRNFIISLRANI